jgi:hypothetical protein
VEAAVVQRAVAEIEGEEFFVEHAAAVGKAVIGAALGAIAQPLVLGHGFDEEVFGGTFGAIFFEQG